MKKLSEGDKSAGRERLGSPKLFFSQCGAGFPNHTASWTGWRPDPSSQSQLSRELPTALSPHPVSLNQRRLTEGRGPFPNERYLGR